MYTAADFNIENAPKEMVQYVIDNVSDFDIRYYHALTVIDHQRCPLCVADIDFYLEILDKISDWILDNDIPESEMDNIDIDEIFC